MSTTTYKGARYLPKFSDPVEWDITKEYEAIEVVQYQASTYISKQPVPAGVQIDDEAFWLLWADPNAQMEQLRQMVEQYVGDVEELSGDVAGWNTELQNEVEARENADELLQTVIDNVKTYIDGNGFTIFEHETESKDDTSWIAVKIPRAKVKYDVNNCSGDNTNGKALISNPRDFLKGNQQYFMATNCNYGGSDYPIRLESINYSGTDLSRGYLAHDPNTGNVAYYPAGTNLNEIPANYTSAYAVDSLMIVDGVVQGGLNNTSVEPRTAFGWGDDYYYYIVTEGRGAYQRGMTINELAILCQSLGFENMVNQDGGGSVCMAVNVNGVQKVNTYRDTNYPFNELRKVNLCQCYKFVDANDEISPDFKSAIANYRAFYKGFDSPKPYCSRITSLAIETDDLTVPAIASRNTVVWDAVRTSEDFSYEAVARIPLPFRHYISENVIINGMIEVVTPSLPDSNKTGRVTLRVGHYENGEIASDFALPLNFEIKAGEASKRVYIPFIYKRTISSGYSYPQYVAQVELTNCNGCSVPVLMFEAYPENRVC